MFNRLRNSRLFFWSLEVLVVITVIFMLSKISFVFSTGHCFYFDIIYANINCWFSLLFI